MKKNILSIIILALLIVNIVLTSVMMFNVTSTNKKVADLVGNIATVMNLELTVPGQEVKEEISLKDTAFYAIANPMTMPLAAETVADGQSKQGYLVCNVSFSLNTKHKDYKTYGSDEAMAEQEGLLKDAINTIVSKHTASELQADPGLEGLKAEILAAVQELFQSDFIYKVSISEVKYG
ncbi:MAG: flagellar basal body-associated FliL family protein [Acetatifactor sp.]|nr:flagellar basal body-associated FliL family protein [Acetatifactor sp.]MDE6701623.1 flagellar basal body-associated FliL family protein [Acetatifactor sp.]